MQSLSLLSLLSATGCLLLLSPAVLELSLLASGLGTGLLTGTSAPGSHSLLLEGGVCRTGFP